MLNAFAYRLARGGICNHEPNGGRAYQVLDILELALFPPLTAIPREGGTTALGAIMGGVRRTATDAMRGPVSLAG